MPLLFLKCLFFVENAHFLGKMPFFSEKCYFSRKNALFLVKRLNYAIFRNAFSRVKICLFKIRNALFHEKCPFVSKLKLKSAPFKRSMPSFSSFPLFLLFLKRAFFSKRVGLKPPKPPLLQTHKE